VISFKLWLYWTKKILRNNFFCSRRASLGGSGLTRPIEIFGKPNIGSGARTSDKFELDLLFLLGSAQCLALQQLHAAQTWWPQVNDNLGLIRYYDVPVLCCVVALLNKSWSSKGRTIFQNFSEFRPFSLFPFLLAPALSPIPRDIRTLRLMLETCHLTYTCCLHSVARVGERGESARPMPPPHESRWGDWPGYIIRTTIFNLARTCTRKKTK